MKKIWHPFDKWEETPAGLWRKISKQEEERLLPIAVEFTGDHELYGSFMRRVTQEWRFSCEHNLTDKSLNRRAWLGHAACCLATTTPEYVTRMAWWKLTQQQQDDANAQASAAIRQWELHHAKT